MTNNTNAPRAIITDTNGLQAATISLPMAGVEVPVYYARPEHGSSFPVVLVVSEIFGLHEYLADVCRRLAKEGYLALAPELFLRQGDPTPYGNDLQKLVAEVVSKVPDAQVLGDLDACLDWALANGGDVGRVGINGFCWGGRLTWLYAAHNPLVKAGVAWYGRLQGPTDALRPRHPVDITGELQAPVLGLYGGQDSSIPLEQVTAMEVALKNGSAAAKQSHFIVYTEAGHAFHADYRPMYVESAAREGWKEMLGWLRAHGVG